MYKHSMDNGWKSTRSAEDWVSIIPTDVMIDKENGDYKIQQAVGKDVRCSSHVAQYAIEWLESVAAGGEAMGRLLRVASADLLSAHIKGELGVVSFVALPTHQPTSHCMSHTAPPQNSQHFSVRVAYAALASLIAIVHGRGGQVGSSEGIGVCLPKSMRGILSVPCSFVLGAFLRHAEDGKDHDRDAILEWSLESYIAKFLPVSADTQRFFPPLPLTRTPNHRSSRRECGRVSRTALRVRVHPLRLRSCRSHPRVVSPWAPQACSVRQVPLEQQPAR